MTHFVTLVIGDDVEGQLAPYHEFECTGIVDQYVIDVDKTVEARADYENHKDDYPTLLEFIKDWYGTTPILQPGEQPDRNGAHQWGWVEVDAAGEVVKYIDRTNPNRKWDWYQVGGRWADYFLLKEGATGTRGEVSWASRDRHLATLAEERRIKRHHADSARKGDIDWEGMAAESRRDAERTYDEFLAEDSPPEMKAFLYDVAIRPDIKARANAFDDREKARAYVEALGLDAFESRDEYVERQTRRAGITRVVVKDGVWMERGEAGWFGTFNDVMPEEEWDKKYWELLESLPNNTLLTIVDCHI